MLEIHLLMCDNKENLNWNVKLDMASLEKQEIARYMQNNKSGAGQKNSVNFVCQQQFALPEHIGMIIDSYLACHFVQLHNDDWIIDMGATSHICSNKSLFTTLTTLDQPIKLALPDGQSNHVFFTSLVFLSPNLTLLNKLYTPNFKHHLIFVPKKIQQNNVKFFFLPNKCYLQDLQTEVVLGKGKALGNLYFFYHDTSNKHVGVHANVVLMWRIMWRIVLTMKALLSSITGWGILLMMYQCILIIKYN